MAFNLTPLQTELLMTVAHHLQSEPWYRGVCLHNFPSNNEISVDYNGAIHQVITATALRDDPSLNPHPSLGLHPCL